MSRPASPGADPSASASTAPASLGAVVVVNYGSSGLLAQNLPTVEPGSAHQVVVVDNFSTTDERQAVRALAAQRGWQVVCSANRGYGAGVNRGVERAVELEARAVVVANPDLRADAHVVHELLEHVVRDERALVVPLSQRPDGRDAPSSGSLDPGSGFTRSDPALPPYAVRWLSGSCLACSTVLWARLEGMDEDLFMYWEDIDLSYRAVELGCTLEVREDLMVTHVVGGTQGRVKSSLYYYFNCRNRLVFARKHLDAYGRTAWAARSVCYLRRVVLREGRRRVLAEPGLTLLPALRGTAAGLLRALEPRA